FGPEGVEGKITPGPFHNLADGLLNMPDARKLALRLRPDGTFTAGSQDILPAGQFLATSVLSDRQRRRHEFYRDFLQQPRMGQGADRNILLAWAEPID